MTSSWVRRYHSNWSTSGILGCIAAISGSTIESYTTMYIPPWAPLVGGLIVLGGGVIVGHARAHESVQSTSGNSVVSPES